VIPFQLCTLVPTCNAVSEALEPAAMQSQKLVQFVKANVGRRRHLE
jgi:hypothetical protein